MQVLMSEQRAPKILVIEDETTQRILVKEYLEESGYVVRLAEDGKRGLEMATALEPDLILLDLLLPSMDGYELCERLKQNEATAHIPVILVTASRETDVIERGMAAGASDFVTKPVDWSFLADRVAHVLQQSDEKKQLLEQSKFNEAELFAMLDQRDLSVDQIELIKARIAAPATSDPALNRDSVEREILAVQNEADERVRAAEAQVAAEREARSVAAEAAQSDKVDAERRLWAAIASTNGVHLQVLEELDALTRGVADASEDCGYRVDRRQAGVDQGLLARTRQIVALARYASSDVELQDDEIDLVRSLEDAKTAFERANPSMHLRVSVDASPAPMKVTVDAQQICNALRLSIGCALRASNNVETGVDVRINSAKGAPVQVQVACAGWHIEPEAQAALQEMLNNPASALETMTAVRFDLLMSNQIATRHGGKLSVTSDVENGTVLTVELPAVRRVEQLEETPREEVKPEAAPRHDGEPLAKLNALLAD